ncbi:MAG: hypothetical protein KJO17_13410 [Acidimicrobiia bacterium]|nr:hypothetical protein [Acidimicrobiia bacterium]NNC39124.1 hypothetical protein [Acidimicrobiia bacterium]NNL69316.1 hypothetical protein [Acidimicrobiia bacterium]
MSYDLAVWEGEQPDSDADAAKAFGELVDRYLEQGVAEPTTRAVREYVEALLERWPDITGEGSQDSPWATGPIAYDNIGSFFYMTMRYDRARAAITVAADLATELGLVCFDPQTGKLHRRAIHD